MTKIKYEIYVRKSQEPDDRQVLSIPAQVKECQSKFEELDAREVVQESFSAKAPGRPLFNSLLDRVEKGLVQGIIAWHPDRLSRNSVDAGRIIYLLDTGRLKELKFCSYTFENSPEGKWMLSMVMSQAKYQVDKLSVDVKRGNRQKYQSGGITWRAMQGYVHNQTDRTIEPDPVRFALVRKMWDMLLSGAFTVPEIRRVANEEWGYRTRRDGIKSGDRPLANSSIYRLFKNPLYAGQNVRPDGTIFCTKHQPMISIEEFWVAQRILGLKGRAKPRERRITAYTDRLIRCGECGCSITVDRVRKVLKNGRELNFEYYRCTKKRGHCSQRYIERHALEDQVGKFLSSISPSRACLKWMEKYLRERADTEELQDTARNFSRTRASEVIEREIKNLSVMRRKDQIDESEFLEQRSELLVEREKLSGPPKHGPEPEWLEPALRELEFGFGCLHWFLNGSEEDKKVIVSRVAGSNLQLSDKRLHFQAVGSFAIMARRVENVDWLGFAEDIRTYFVAHPDEPSAPRFPSNTGANSSGEGPDL